MSQEIPQILGRYEIQEEIGRGMMGVVYRAFDPVLGRTVALKTVSLTFANLTEEGEGFERRFLTEARVAAALSHPGIVVVHDVGRDTATQNLYIALEYIQGETLGEHLRRRGRLPWRESFRLVAGVADALHHAHLAGVVHRDIKPANIMVLPSGETKIMDFGIAKVAAAQLTSAGEFFGTPLYMSPEQARGEAVDARSDIFSLGSVLYLLLTGQRPFDAPTVPGILGRVAGYDPPPASAANPELPSEADAIVARCLAKSPDDRYPDASALARDIAALLEGRFEVVLEEVPPNDSWWERLADRLGARGLLALVAVVLTAVAGSLIVTRSSSSPAPARTVSAARAAGGTSPTTMATAAGGPAQLDLTFEHPFKSGSLKVWVDDELVVEEALSSRERRRLRFLKSRKGEESATLDVPPGEHVVRVVVESEDFNSSRRIRGTFESGETRHLAASVGGLLRKELTLTWGARE